MIWGMTLHPGVEYTREVMSKEYFTMASLDCRARMSKGGSNPIAHVLMKTNYREIVLCTLEKGIVNQQGLNFILLPGEDLTLSVEGTGVVYISGYTMSSPQISDDTHNDTKTASLVECNEEPFTVSCPQVPVDLHNDGCTSSSLARRREEHSEISDNFTPGYINTGEGGADTNSPEPVTIAERWDEEDVGNPEDEVVVNSAEEGTMFIKLDQFSLADVVAEHSKVRADQHKDGKMDPSDEALTLQNSSSILGRPQLGPTDKSDVVLKVKSVSCQKDEANVNHPTVGSVKNSQSNDCLTEGVTCESHQEELQQQCDKKNQNGFKRKCLHSLEKKQSKLDKRPVPAENLQHQFVGKFIEKPFKCQFCPKSFNVKTNLVCHERTHTGERPYGCQFCPKAFSTARNLRQHVRIHTGEKPFHCQLCGKSFARKFTFDCHMNSHSGVKPFKCQYCIKSFANKQDMTRHEKTHSGEKPYDCQLCGKSFTRKSSLNYHIDKLHTSGNDVKVKSE